MRVLASLVLVCLTASGCETTADLRTVRSVRLAAGLPGAGFNPLGVALADALQQSLPQFDFEVMQSDGAVSNIQALHAGTADLGLAFADVAYRYYAGHVDQPNPRFDLLRGIAVLPVAAVHLAVRSDANIQQLSDLRGRTVGVGPLGSGTALTAALLLESVGLSDRSVGQKAMPFVEAANQLVAGRLDAVFVNAAYPAESILSATSKGARLLNLSGPVIDHLRNDHLFLRLTLIPGGTYPGHDDTVRTIGFDSLLLCRADLDEELVYTLTKSFFDVLPSVAEKVSALRRMDLDRAAAVPIPLHEGAARYYREQELLR